MKWIKACVTTVSVNVLVNGSPSGEFNMEKGIRQGDPLSPFLFLIAAEGLSVLTHKAIEDGLLKGVEVGRDKVKVSIIQYADDTIFAIDGTKDNVDALKRLLKDFELTSGL